MYVKNIRRTLNTKDLVEVKIKIKTFVSVSSAPLYKSSLHSIMNKDIFLPETDTTTLHRDKTICLLPRLNRSFLL